MLGTFRDYDWREKEDGNIIFTRVQQRRVTSLMDWVKDKTRLEEEASFPYGTTRQELIWTWGIHNQKEVQKWTKEMWGIFDHNYLPSTARSCRAMRLLGVGAWKQPKNGCRSTRHSIVLNNQGEQRTWSERTRHLVRKGSVGSTPYRETI